MAYVTGTASATLADPLIKILYSEDLHMETLDELWFTKAGMTKRETGNEEAFDRKASAPIIIKDEFGKERGQRIRLALQKQLKANRAGDTASGAGSGNLATTNLRSNDATNGIRAKTYGSTSMIDAEEVMELYDLEVVVEQYKHATAFDTPGIQDLKTNFRMDDRARNALQVWLKDQKEEAIVDALSDGNAAHVIRSGLKSATAHPNQDNVGSTASVAQGSLTSSHTLSTAELRRMWAKLSVNNINPIQVDGQECYALLAPVQCVNDLDADSDYRNAFQHAAPRSSDNPLFTRASHKYAGIYVHEYNRCRNNWVSSASEANEFQLPLLGSDAIVLGNASEPVLVNRKEDAYGDKYGVGIKCIFGAARADFQNTGDSVTLNQSSYLWVAWGATV